MKNFSEIQSFKWIWIITLTPVVIILGSGFAVFKSHDADRTEGLIALGIAFVITLGLSIWLRSLRLETRIGNGMLFVQFHGLPRAKREIDLRDVKKLEIVTYDPLFEYGGWGLRYSFKKGWCYNVSGDKGLRITYSDGKQFLLGTEKPEELREALRLS